MDLVAGRNESAGNEEDSVCFVAGRNEIISGRNEC
jgi:hypothetical protein